MPHLSPFFLQSSPPPEKKFFAWFCSFLLCLCFKSSLSLPDVALYGILALVNLPVVEGDIFRTLHVSVNGQRLINKNVLVAIDWENVRTIFGIKQKECAEEDCHKAVQRCAPDGKSGWRVFFFNLLSFLLKVTRQPIGPSYALCY